MLLPEATMTSVDLEQAIIVKQSDRVQYKE